MTDLEPPSAPELGKKPKRELVIPTSFRFLPETLEKIDQGAAVFRMNRTKWLEFLIDSSLAGRPICIQTERAKISIEFTVLNARPRRLKTRNIESLM
jgi:hypothetical protein